MLKIVFPLISLFLLTSQMSNIKNLMFYITSTSMVLTPIVFMGRLDYMTCFSDIWKTDLLSTPLISLSVWIMAMMTMASNSVYYNMDRTKTFTLTVMILTVALLMAFFTSSLFNFFIFFETSLIPTLFLILGWGYQPERTQAGLYLMLYTITASLPLLMLIAHLMKMNSHTTMMFYMLFPMISKTAPYTYMMILVGAFMVKMPVYFVHLWLPKAHVEAPVAGSMILAGLLLKLGSYGLIRILVAQPQLTHNLKLVFLPVSLVGAIITSFICIRQTDMKSLIAYSSVGHMALLVSGALSATLWGLEGALTLMVAHGLCSSALFYLAYSTYTATKTRSTLMMKGILNFFPILTTFWFVFSIFNMAAPPSINLLSEIILISSIMSTSMHTTTVLMLISFTAAVYSLILYTALNHGYPTPTSSPMNHFSPNSYMILIMHLSPMLLLISNPSIMLSSM